MLPTLLVPQHLLIQQVSARSCHHSDVPPQYPLILLMWYCLAIHQVSAALTRGTRLSVVSDLATDNGQSEDTQRIAHVFHLAMEKYVLHAYDSNTMPL